MINNTQKYNLYLAGGIMYIQPYLQDGTLSNDKYDMGATEVTLTRDTQTASAFTRSAGLKQKIAEVVTEENYTMKITCNSFSPINLANALGSSVQTIEFKDGDILPDGQRAQGKYTFIKIDAGINPLLKAKLIFVGVPVRGKRVIAIVHEANIKMSGDLPLMSEDFATMSFEGSANKTKDGYYTHYIEEARTSQKEEGEEGSQGTSQSPQGSEEEGHPQEPLSDAKADGVDTMQEGSQGGLVQAPQGEEEKTQGTQEAQESLPDTKD